MGKGMPRITELWKFLGENGWENGWDVTRGCKWDASEVKVFSDDEDCIEIHFVTPWDMPRAWYKKLRSFVKILPDVIMEYTMTDGFEEEYDKVVS